MVTRSTQGRGFSTCASWIRERLALAVALSALCLTLITAGDARAGGLTKDEKARLERGEVVRRELEFELDTGRYVGGVAYVIINAPAERVMAALLDIKAYPQILPLLSEAKDAGARGGDRLVQLTHFVRVGTTQYTTRVRREDPGLVRFWVDPSFPHDMDDAWGYFRVHAIDTNRVLFSYGVALNLGFGIARILFESKIQGFAMRTPELVKRYVESR